MSTKNIPRGKYKGRPVDGRGQDDPAQHLIDCPLCGGKIDCSDLGSVADHAGPLPHPADDQPQ